MKRFIYTASLCLGLGLVSTSLAQPPERGRPGFVPPKQQATNSSDLERKLDRLDAQLKAIEGRLAGMKSPESRRPDAPKGPGFDRARFAPGNPPGPRAFGQGFGGSGSSGPATTGGGSGFGTARRDGGSNPDFEKRLDKIIGELEQLKKDMKGGQRGGR